jgi:hypothetical protein
MRFSKIVLFSTIGLSTIVTLATVAPATHAQAPAEMPALKRDYAEDLLALFSWGLDIRFTEAEKARFIKEREMEWESGNNTWHSIFIGDYWMFLILSKDRQAGNKEPMKKRLLDFIVYNAKAGQPDCIWIQKRLGQDDEVNDLPISKARRTALEKMAPSASVDSMEVEGILGGTITRKLSAVEVSDTLSKISEMFQIPLTPEQRTEFVERAKKHWRKYPSDWSSKVNSNKNPISYVQSHADYIVYKNDTVHNIKKLEEFAERGERDAVWLLKLYNESWQQRPVIASEPSLNRSIINEYAVLRTMQLNEIVGQRAVIADVPLIASMQKEIVAKWATYPESKKKSILGAPKALSFMYQVYPHCTPFYKEHQKHLWGQDIASATPQIKPIVDARAKEFAIIAKKNPDWKTQMENNNETALQAYLQRKQAEYDRQLKMMDKIYDSMVFSNKMTSINNAILRAPAGSTVHIDIRP